MFILLLKACIKHFIRFIVIFPTRNYRKIGSSNLGREMSETSISLPKLRKMAKDIYT